MCHGRRIADQKENITSEEDENIENSEAEGSTAESESESDTSDDTNSDDYDSDDSDADGGNESGSWDSDDSEDEDDDDEATPERRHLSLNLDSTSTTPKFSIDQSVMPTDVRFHDSEQILATSDMNGFVKLWKFGDESGAPELKCEIQPHRTAARSIRFTKSSQLVSIGKDKRICVLDIQEGKVASTFKKAHDASIYCLLPIGENGLVTGDDSGCIKAWDLRDPEPIVEFQENNEFISAFATDEAEKMLLATSGDGTLSAFDIRSKKLKLQSEAFPAELLSICVLKNGSKVLCGSGDGNLLVFNWGEWGYTLDQYPPSEEYSIEAIEKYSEDRVITATSDGLLRCLNVLPYQMVGYCASHSLPFERISLSSGKDLLASTSHDNFVRLWDVSKLKNVPGVESDDSSDSEGEGTSKPDGGKKRTNKSTKMPKRPRTDTGDFFSDL